MILNFFAKRSDKRSDHPLADGKELKRILAELHVDKAAKAVDEVSGWFDSLQRAENFRVDHYFDVIRQLDDVAQPHLLRLARDYLLSPRLSKFEEERLWTRSYGYLGQIAALCTGCIERARLDPKSKGSDAFKASLPLAIVRSQAARRCQLKWLAYRYGANVEDLWKSLGATYLDADALALGQKSVQLYPSRRGLFSVAQQYLHAIVFYTSSMDSLMPVQIELADRLIAHFLPHFMLLQDCRPDSVYWVDAAAGSAPLRLALHPGAHRPGLRFFSPGTALPALEDLLHLVERGEVPADLNLGGEYAQRALLPVLRHLRVYWAKQPPQRRHQRHAVKTRMRVLHGFDHSYSVFSGVLPRLDKDSGLESWVVENVSLGGFRAHVDDSASGRIKLGSLLCVQPEGGDNWLLGVARRFSRRAGGQASLGVQVLSRQAQSIELRPRRSGFSAAVAIPGIWLRDAGESGVLRIVLPPSGFNVREALEFNDQGQGRMLTPVELEEAGSDYEIGRFHPQVPG
ncbi:MAG: hypothetical protein KDI45_02415 [Candidatus Accumulibacter sp.]|nr:hypothetical protein [Accumulibacter sp.]